ncbi:MAG: hypothetical protein HY226_00365 [Candidatus Vogelbacteria bacterium]|nr:hypothetical protein [Candidatus Vogelbacteria bacterium]
MWSISETVNNVRITKKCARELFKAQDYEEELWSSLEYVTSEGNLYFNPDHNEHMDYLGTHDNMTEILKRHKVKGDICFGSLEGDDEGSFWGYRFDGKGGMVKLSGEVVYTEVEKTGQGG